MVNSPWRPVEGHALGQPTRAGPGSSLTCPGSVTRLSEGGWCCVQSRCGRARHGEPEAAPPRSWREQAPAPLRERSEPASSSWPEPLGDTWMAAKSTDSRDTKSWDNPFRTALPMLAPRSSPVCARKHTEQDQRYRMALSDPYGRRLAASAGAAASSVSLRTDKRPLFSERSGLILGLTSPAAGVAAQGVADCNLRRTQQINERKTSTALPRSAR